EIADLVAGLPGGPVRLRNEAMLALMWRLGLRAGEVGALQLGDINWRVGGLWGPRRCPVSRRGRWPALVSLVAVALTGCGIPLRAGCFPRVAAWSRWGSCCDTPARRQARSTPAPTKRRSPYWRAHGRPG